MTKPKPSRSPTHAARRRGRLTIGEVSAETGLAGSALRYYEREGLIPRAPKEGGRRIYEPEILDRLAVIELAKRAGMTIAETRRLIDPPGRRRPAARAWHQLATDKLDEIDERIENLVQMKRVLHALTSCECPSIEDCGRAMREAESRPSDSC